MVSNEIKKLIGTVIGTQMKNTVNVRVAHTVQLSKYNKIMTKHTNYLAHEETGECFIGDVVSIAPCTRLTARKHHVVTGVVRRASRYIDKVTNFIYTNGHSHVPVGRVVDGKQENFIRKPDYQLMGFT